MNELSYAQARDIGIDPALYQFDLIEVLGIGTYPGTLDHLVWARSKPILQALVTLNSGHKIKASGFQRHSRHDLPEYFGYRNLVPGMDIHLVVDRNSRGLQCLVKEAHS